MTLNILKEFTRGACPVCSARSKAESDFMKAVPLTISQSPDEAQRLFAEEGLCNLHCWDLIHLASPATAARFCYQVLRYVTDAMDKLKGISASAAAKRLRSAFRRPSASDAIPCRACRFIHDAEREAILSVAEQLKMPDFRAHYRNAGGLCAPHAILLLDLLRSNQDAQFIVETLRETMENLARAIEPFARRVEAGQWQRQTEVAIRAMQKLVGVRRVEPT